MKKNISIALALCAVLAGMATHAKTIKVRGVIKNAFKAERRYNITEHGAVGDSTTLNTVAIQAVIDLCAKNGGGTLVIPRGIYKSGALFLKPGVNIDILEGGVLKGSTDINDYPKGMTRIEGHFEPWRAALLNGDKVDNLRITGKGMLDGSGKPFWIEFYSRRSADNKTTNLNVERPRLMFIENSKNVLISGISFHNSGFWNLHLYHNQKVKVDNCRFEAPHGQVPNNHAPSSDGIDVDSSQDIEISHCFFSVGDDDIALKGSKGPFAMDDKDSPPVERIHIHECTFEAGGGIMTCGSEATIVRDVTVDHCTTRGPVVMRLKLRPDTPQQYENISISDITIEGSTVIIAVAPWTQYFDLKGQPAPKSIVRNVTIANVKGTGSSLGRIAGNPSTDISGVTLKNFDVTLKNAGFEQGNVKDLTVDNVVVNGTALALPVAAPKQ